MRSAPPLLVLALAATATVLLAAPITPLCDDTRVESAALEAGQAHIWNLHLPTARS